MENLPRDAYGGFWRRLLACALDCLVFWITISVFQFLLGFTSTGFGGSSEVRGPVLWMVVVLVLWQTCVCWVYYALWESSTYQATPGKMALGLVVTDLEGNRISISRATGRFFAQTLSVLTLGIGYIMIAFMQKKQGLHNLVAGCLVVRRSAPGKKMAIALIIGVFLSGVFFYLMFPHQLAMKEAAKKEPPKSQQVPSAAGSAAPNLQEFKSKPGRFAVMAPVPLKETTQSIKGKFGKVEMHMFMGQQGDTCYIVSYADFPPKQAHQPDPEKVLDGGRNGMVSNANGKLVFENKITLQGNPGRELVIDAKDRSGAKGTVKARLFLVKNRLYEVMVAAPKGGISGLQMDDFLKSFRLLGQ